MDQVYKCISGVCSTASALRPPHSSSSVVVLQAATMMRKDINKPKGKTSAYAFFVQTCREEHRKKNPEQSVNFAEFSKKCSERWKVRGGAAGTWSHDHLTHQCVSNSSPTRVQLSYQDTVSCSSSCLTGYSGSNKELSWCSCAAAPVTDLQCKLIQTFGRLTGCVSRVDVLCVLRASQHKLQRSTG